MVRRSCHEMYQWARPAVAVPVHGEMRHLVAHAALARELQVPEAVVLQNGQALKLAPGKPEVIGEVPAGRRLLDGDVLVDAGDDAVRERRRLMFNGIATVTVVVDSEGEVQAPPVLVLQGVPLANGEGDLNSEICKAIDAALARLPKSARRDDGRIEEVARIASRRALRQAIGKRPVVTARVVRLRH